MTSEELREKIEKILEIDHSVYGAHGIFGMEKVDSIISLVKQGIEEAEPKKMTVDSFFHGVVAYKSNLLQMVEGKV